MDRTFKKQPNRFYCALYKPFEVLSQFTQPDDSGKRTLAEFDFPPDVYPVGRLDWDSEGLLVLTDDGRLNGALLSPQHGHWRTYLAQVENVPDLMAIRSLEGGVLIQGHKTSPARARLLAEEPELPDRLPPIRVRNAIPTAWIELSLTEGKNRQVRRMTAAVGHPTLRLVRVAIGELTLAELELAPGQWRELTGGQVEMLFR